MSIHSFIQYIEFEKKYSKNTVLAYENDLYEFKNYCKMIGEGGVDIDDVEYKEIRGWIRELVSKGVGNRTINRKVSSLRTYYKFLNKIFKREDNPLSIHKSLKEEKKLQVPLSEKELREIVNEDIDKGDIYELRDNLIIDLMYSTGIRRGELINLKEKSIDYSNNTIKVLGKRNKERYIPLLEEVKLKITEYKDRKEEEGYVNTEYLFITKRGEKINESLLYRIVKKKITRVSTKEGVNPHIIRHTFATHLLDGGADLNSVKELLGHSSLSSTEVYTHSSLEKIKTMYNQAHPRAIKK